MSDMSFGSLIDESRMPDDETTVDALRGTLARRSKLISGRADAEDQPSIRVDV